MCVGGFCFTLNTVMIRLPDTLVPDLPEYETKVDHWNIGLVWYSDDYCADYSSSLHYVVLLSFCFNA